MKSEDGLKKIGLGFQGGGTHTAFSWGVLDRLLDEVAAGNLRIKAISWTSDGAINAAVCVYGLLEGPNRAKRLLRELWELISAQSLFGSDGHHEDVLHSRRHRSEELAIERGSVRPEDHNR